VTAVDRNRSEKPIPMYPYRARGHGDGVHFPSPEGGLTAIGRKSYLGFIPGLLVLVLAIPILIIALQVVFVYELQRPNPIHHTIGHVFLDLMLPVSLTLIGISLLLDPPRIISPRRRRDYSWGSVMRKHKHLESVMTSKIAETKAKKVNVTRGKFIMGWASSRKGP
jgi:hypothetical protein